MTSASETPLLFWYMLIGEKTFSICHTPIKCGWRWNQIWRNRSEGNHRLISTATTLANAGDAAFGGGNVAGSALAGSNSDGGSKRGVASVTRCGCGDERRRYLLRNIISEEERKKTAAARHQRRRALAACWCLRRARASISGAAAAKKSGGGSAATAGYHRHVSATAGGHRAARCCRARALATITGALALNLAPRTTPPSCATCATPAFAGLPFAPAPLRPRPRAA